MKVWNVSLPACVLALLALPAGARAGLLDTVNWAPDTTVDGTGTGTLGAATVTYTTVIGFNAGETFTFTWPTDLGTNAVAGMGVTNLTGGVFGASTTPFLQTITFSSAIVNPILLVNFLEPGDVFDFTGNSVTLLDSFNATLLAGVVSAGAGASDSSNDGFALQFNGTFGPGTPINFLFTAPGNHGGLDSVGFTVGITAVPEPSSLALLGFGAASLVGWRMRKKRAA